MLKRLHIVFTPALIVLKMEQESIQDLLAMDSREMLLRWVQYCMKKAGFAKPVSNLGSDLKDGTVYAHLLFLLGLIDSPKEVLHETDVQLRATKILSLFSKLKPNNLVFMDEEDIVGVCVYVVYVVTSVI